MNKKNSYKHWPDEKGYFGNFGGRYVSETLMPLILEVENKYNEIKDKESFKKEFEYYLEKYVGRPSPLFFAERITKDLNGPKIYFKRYDLNTASVLDIIPDIGNSAIFEYDIVTNNIFTIGNP